MKEIKLEKGITLRPFSKEDKNGYAEVNNDPLTKKMFTSVPADEAELDAEIEEKIGKAKAGVSKTLTILVNGEYAGGVVLEFENWDPKNDVGRVHVWIHPKFRNKGIATKALQWIVGHGFKIGFKRIYAQHKTINLAVAKINKKLGFVLEREMVQGDVKKLRWYKDNPMPAKTKIKF
ncbi:GNAT family N-acetyltransferase [Candidatus Woesearchaeota archaeon]|nr:GNAT family N-acetyltransferase [Candidatus Woesearchaeota archaeon]